MISLSVCRGQLAFAGRAGKDVLISKSKIPVVIYRDSKPPKIEPSSGFRTWKNGAKGLCAG